MNATVPVGAAFRDRYAVQRCRDGGILIDLTTGTYLRLNVSAIDVCTALAEAEGVDSAAAQVARHLGGNMTSALRAVRDVMAGLGLLAPRREPPGSYRYLPSPDGGYVLTSNGAPRLRNSTDGTSAWLAVPDEPMSTAQIFGYLRAIAPKLLFLQSTMVIHGAASQMGEGVRIFSGESGAGKTTTARAFAAAGRQLVAEDMLVVASSSPLHVCATGESAINEWASRSADRLANFRREKIDATVLKTAKVGEPTPVSEIWFIDGGRRDERGRGIRPRRLGETEGALAVMTSLFLGADTPDAWRLFLSIAGDVAATLPLFETLMPAGLDALSAAVKGYTENSAS